LLSSVEYSSDVSIVGLRAGQRRLLTPEMQNKP
jgi:hypothetical protein